MPIFRIKIIRVMISSTPSLNRIVAALLAIVMIFAPLATLGADASRLDQLFEELAASNPQDAQKIARDIELELSRSGSAAMDLLLRRGEDALEGGDYGLAVEHLSALIDHAPDFVEGWHLRSVAFFKQQNYGLALSDIEHVLALEPRHFNAIHGLGVLLEEMSQPELAGEAYSRALSIHPHHEDVIRAMERLHREQGDAEL